MNIVVTNIVPDLLCSQIKRIAMMRFFPMPDRVSFLVSTTIRKHNQSTVNETSTSDEDIDVFIISGYGNANQASPSTT